MTPEREQNTWTAEQRFVLHPLFSQYEFKDDQTVSIFNEVFRPYLDAQQIKNGLTWHKLDIQYRERLRTARKLQWAPIIKEPANAAEQATRDAHIQSIEAAADALTIPLQPAPAEPVAKASAALDMSDLSLESYQPASRAAGEPADSPDRKQVSSQQALSDASTAKQDRGDANIADAASNAAENTNEDDTERAVIVAEAKRQASMRPEVEEGEEYLYMLHSSMLHSSALV